MRTEPSDDSSRNPGIEDEFARFARSHDPRLLTRVFDATAPELLKVARHLVPDEATADDLVQQTFLEAMESAASFDPTRPLLPWLLGILANHVRSWRRADTRRRTHESARPVEGEGADPAEQAASRELCALALRRIAALPEPYRQVLRLHLEHGLAAHEIATVLQRAPATVRKQIGRGMELLRRALPAAVVIATMSVARSLRALRRRVVPASRMPVLGLAGAALVAATVLAAVAKQPIALEPASLARVAAATTAAPVTTRSVAQRETVVQDRATEDNTANTACVRVHLRWDDGTPAKSRGVFAWPYSLPDSFLRKVRARTDEHGIAVIDGVPAGIESIVYVHAGEVTKRVRPARGTTADVELTIERGPIVEGRVLDAEGKPVAGASIVLFQGWPEEATRSGSDGRYRLQLGKLLPSIAAIKPGHAMSWSYCLMTPSPSDVLHLDIPLGGAEARIEGRVTDKSGKPIAGARVLAGEERLGNTGKRAASNAAFHCGSPVPQATTTGADGTFALGSFRPEERPWVDVRVRLLGYAPLSQRVALRPRRTEALTLELERGGRVSGRVTDAGGNPVEGATVLHARYGSFLSSQSYTDGDGRYELNSLPLGSITLRAAKSELGRDAIELHVDAGHRKIWNPSFGTNPALFGRVTDVAGKGLAAWRVVAWYSIDQYNERSYYAKTSTSGLFRFPDVGERPYRISAHAPGAPQPSVELRDVRAHDSPLAIRIAADRIPSATLRGRVVDAAGVPYRGRVIIRPPAGAFFGIEGLDASALKDGSFKLGPLLTGSYALELHTDTARVSLGAVEATSALHDVGTLRIPPIQDVELELLDGTTPLVPSGASVTDMSGAQACARPTITGGIVRARLIPGRYLVACLIDGVRVVREIEVDAATKRLQLRRDDGTEHTIDLQPSLPLGPNEMLCIAIRDAAGKLRFCWQQHPQMPNQHRVNLPAFAGTLTARARFQHASLSVAFGPRCPADIEVVLREGR